MKIFYEYLELINLKIFSSSFNWLESTCRASLIQPTNKKYTWSFEPDAEYQQTEARKKVACYIANDLRKTATKKKHEAKL